MTPSEKKAKAFFESQGYEVIRGGWPDFLIINNQTGDICGIEVKSNSGQERPIQQKLHAILRKAGFKISVLISKPDGTLIDRGNDWPRLNKSEKTKAGLRVVVANGKRLGRPILAASSDQVSLLKREGLSRTEIADRLGMSTTTLWRRLKQEKQNPSNLIS